jgi:hypothetical protein
VPRPPLWWPHTHGEPALLDWSLAIEGRVVAGGKVGFRRLDVRQDGTFEARVNGEPVYCRGACWTIDDVVTLDADAATLERDLRLARDAGVNMLRVGGTMVYESDRFYDLCDELGVLVWQDFMFANMDYPVEDADFAAEVEAEAAYQLDRLARHPCVAVSCGNSEVEQQAAMRGVPPGLWRHRWFADDLPALCAERHPGTAYVPSTPGGGALPFHVGAGVAHYYGVGAYLRPPSDVRRAGVKFAAECLAFANVPEAETVAAITGGPPATHHPRWKERVPRDAGAAWDFEDVRDHYLRLLFGVDPVQARCFDLPRYLRRSRVVPGEMRALALTAAGPSGSDDVEAAGFVLTRQTADALSRLDLLECGPLCRRALLAAPDDAPAAARLAEHLSAFGCRTERVDLPGLAEMLAEPHKTHIPSRAIEQAVAWLAAEAPAVRPEADIDAPPPLAEAVVLQGPAGGVRERPVFLSRRPEVFGIVSEPAAGPADGLPAVVLLNAGSAHRVGPGRLYAQLARRLAALGFLCVRLDLCGLGDSAADGERENDPYPPTAFRDVELTLEHLRAELGVRRAVLLGLCSGAYTAFQRLSGARAGQ